jgi:hypothetical protein
MNLKGHMYWHSLWWKCPPTCPYSTFRPHFHIEPQPHKLKGRCVVQTGPIRKCCAPQAVKWSQTLVWLVRSSASDCWFLGLRAWMRSTYAVRMEGTQWSAHSVRSTLHISKKLFEFDHWLMYMYIQWGKKVFSQPPIVHVLPLKKMREACNFHHRYTSTMTDKITK